MAIRMTVGPYAGLIREYHPDVEEALVAMGQGEPLEDASAGEGLEKAAAPEQKKPTAGAKRRPKRSRKKS